MLKIAMTKSDMVKLYNELYGGEISQKVLTERLNKACSLFKNEHFPNILDFQEKYFFTEFISPVIERKKYLSIISVVFFIPMIKNIDSDLIKRYVNKDFIRNTEIIEWIYKIESDFSPIAKKLFNSNLIIKKSEREKKRLRNNQKLYNSIKTTKINSIKEKDLKFNMIMSKKSRSYIISSITIYMKLVDILEILPLKRFNENIHTILDLPLKSVNRINQKLEQIIRREISELKNEQNYTIDDNLDYIGYTASKEAKDKIRNFDYDKAIKKFYEKNKDLPNSSIEHKDQNNMFNSQILDSKPSIFILSMLNYDEEE